MSEKIPIHSNNELETRPGQHESIESVDRDIDKLRARVARLTEATTTLPEQSRDILLFEANEIFLLLQKLFFYLEHDWLRGNVGLAASTMSSVHEQLKNSQQEQNQVLAKVDEACNLLHIASECSRIADQIHELMVAVSEIEKKLKKLP